MRHPLENPELVDTFSGSKGQPHVVLLEYFTVVAKFSVRLIMFICCLGTDKRFHSLEKFFRFSVPEKIAD